MTACPFFFFLNFIENCKSGGACKNIVIDNKILCRRDRATGIVVEHMNDAVEVMTNEGENEVNSPIAQQPCQHSLSTSFVVEHLSLTKEKGVG